MISSLHFVYDDISSRDMKVTQVSSNGGLFEETFLATKNIKEDRVPGNDIPYLLGVDRDPLTLPLAMYFQPDLNEHEVRSITRWLDQDTYKPFYFEDNPNRIYYAMYIGDSRRLHNGIEKGVVYMQFRTNSPYSFSPVYTSGKYDLSSNDVDGTIINFPNEGDVNCSPIIEFTKVGNGDIRIVNESDGGLELKMSNLFDNETIMIDSKHEDISTNIEDKNRYSDHNNIFLDLPRGINYLRVYGKCKDLKFTYQFNTKH